MCIRDSRETSDWSPGVCGSRLLTLFRETPLFVLLQSSASYLCHVVPTGLSRILLESRSNAGFFSRRTVLTKVTALLQALLQGTIIPLLLLLL